MNQILLLKIIAIFYFFSSGEILAASSNYAYPEPSCQPSFYNEEDNGDCATVRSLNIDMRRPRPMMTCLPDTVWSGTQGRCVSRSVGRSWRPPAPICPSGYRWDREHRRCARQNTPAPVCPSYYRWNERLEKCVRYTPRPTPQPEEERGKFTLHYSTSYFSEPAEVNLTSVVNNVEHQVNIKGVVHTTPLRINRSGHGMEFNSFELMKKYLLEHACQVEDVERNDTIVFKPSNDTTKSKVEKIVLGKGSLSNAARLKIMVTYLLLPAPRTRGQLYMRSTTIDCP